MTSVKISYELETSYSMIPFAIPKQRAASETASIGASVAEMSGVISQLLAQHGIYAHRTSITGDGSHLLQFFSGVSDAGVDIFPNGDIVVIIRKGRVESDLSKRRRKTCRSFLLCF